MNVNPQFTNPRITKPRVRWQRRSDFLWRAWVPGKEALIPLDSYDAEPAALKYILPCGSQPQPDASLTGGVPLSCGMK